MRIVCVGAPHARQYLSAALAESNYSVTGIDHFEDAAYVASLASAPPVHAVIVLAPAEPLQAVQALATRPAHTLLVIVARDDDSDLRAAALEAGADICVPVGYDYAELDARLRAFTRGRPTGLADQDVSASFNTSTSPSIATQTPTTPLPQLSPATRSLGVAGGASLLLRQREYLLLDCLLAKPGHTVGYDDLLDCVFGTAEADTISLHQLVSRLRPRLARAGLQLHLQAEPGTGYRLHHGKS